MVDFLINYNYNINTSKSTQANYIKLLLDWSEKMNWKEDIEPNIDNEDWEDMKESDPNLSDQ